MVNINTLNAALWKIQIAKTEAVAYNKRNGLEGTWQASQQIAELTYQEVALQNAVNLYKIGHKIMRADEIEFLANRIIQSFPAIH